MPLLFFGQVVLLIRLYMLIGNSPQVLGGVALGIVFSACGVSGSGRKVLSERISGQIYISEVTTPAWRMTLNSGISSFVTLGMVIVFTLGKVTKQK